MHSYMYELVIVATTVAGEMYCRRYMRLHVNIIRVYDDDDLTEKFVLLVILLSQQFVVRPHLNNCYTIC